MKAVSLSFFLFWAAAFFAPSALLAATDPQQLVKGTSDKMIEALQREKDNLKKDPARVYALVDDIVLPHFDFERMAKLVLAQYWKDATPEQQQRFTTEFRSLIVRTYAISLAEYSDEEITFLPTRGDLASKRVVIRTEVKKPSDPKFKVPIDYEMYLPAEEWKVFNVTVDGVSLVTNYRNSFAEDIRKNGIDALINSLAQKTVEANKPQ